MRRRRAALALRDLFARLRGRCNRAPLYMVDGGYHFWRCGLRCRHDGPCRTGNYWWGPGGSVYDLHTPFTASPNRPAGVETRRQRRSRRRWHDLADMKRAVEARDAEAVVREAERAIAFKPTDQGDW